MIMHSHTALNPHHRLSVLLLSVSLLLGGCGSLSKSDYGPSYSMDMRHVPDLVPKNEPKSRGGNPKSYVVLGKRYYVMESSRGYQQRGIASWYGKKFHGRKTSNGETYNMYAMSAAHKTLPIPTYLRVTNLKNGRSTIVRVNDRGPFHDNRIIDLSYAAASKLGIVESGTGLVEITAITPGVKPPRKPAKPKTIMVKATQNETRQANPAPRRATQQAPVVQNNESVQLYLQIGAFISRHNAEQLRSRLVLNNHTMTTVKQGRNHIDKTIYRVRIGPLASVDEADQLARKLLELNVGSPKVVIE